VICETRREQITDVYGWRVRDVGRVPFALVPSELARRSSQANFTPGSKVSNPVRPAAAGWPS